MVLQHSIITLGYVSCNPEWNCIVDITKKWLYHASHKATYQGVFVNQPVGTFAEGFLSFQMSPGHLQVHPNFLHQDPKELDLAETESWLV